jgi:hypothetical protein
MPSYLAYGLTINSEFEIPELRSLSPDSVEPDVWIRRRRIAQPTPGDPTGKGRAYCLDSGETAYVKSESARFLVADGTEIVVEPEPDVDERVWRLSLFGPALALILIQRGFLVLHGGAVAFGDRAALVLGPGGMGKSTLTAELCQQGGSLLTDDVVAIDMDAAIPRVLPGVPLLKLWPDAVDAAPAGSWTKLLHPDFKKVGRRMDDAVLAAPSSVARIFVLAGGDELEREPLTGMDAFRALMASQFSARYGGGFLERLDGRDLLDKFTRLLEHTPVEVLRRPRDRDRLPETAALIRASIEE